MKIRDSTIFKSESQHLLNLLKLLRHPYANNLYITYFHPNQNDFIPLHIFNHFQYKQLYNFYNFKCFYVRHLSNMGSDST